MFHLSLGGGRERREAWEREEAARGGNVNKEEGILFLKGGFS